MPNYSLAVGRTIRAPLSTAFDAWTDAATVRQWMKPRPGVIVSDAALAPAPGGHFRIVMRAAAREERHEGTYQVVDRPARLRFTWSSDGAGPGTVVTVTFESTPAGDAAVSLVHEGFQNQTARDDHRDGWRNILDNLAALIETRQ